MPYSTTTMLARKGRGGDTELGHLSNRDVVVPMEIQTPEIRKQLREILGDKMDKFTVGSAWTSRNPETGLAEFTDRDPDQSDLGNAITPVAGPSGSLAEPAAGPPHGQQDPWQDIFKNVVSGMQPVADAGGDKGGPGNPGGGQPGSAGTGTGKSAIDAAFGLAAGAIAPGFGIASLAAKALTDPNFDLASALSFGLTGDEKGFPGAITDPKTIDNMGINPGAYGMEKGPVGQLTSSESPQQQAAQQAALDAISQGRDTGTSPGGWGNIGTTGDPGARDFSADPGRDTSGGKDSGGDTGGHVGGGGETGTGHE